MRNTSFIGAGLYFHSGVFFPFFSHSRKSGFIFFGEQFFVGFFSDSCFDFDLISPPVGLFLIVSPQTLFTFDLQLTHDFSHPDHDARDADQAFGRRSELRRGPDARPVYPAVKGQLQAWTTGSSE